MLTNICQPFGCPQVYFCKKLFITEKLLSASADETGKERFKGPLSSKNNFVLINSINNNIMPSESPIFLQCSELLKIASKNT